MLDLLMTPVGWAVQCVALSGLMLAGSELGQRWARRRSELDGEHVHTGVRSIEASVFALLGLLIAFTFAGATERVERRRQVLVEEANALSTVYLRLDLLPEPTRGRAQALLRDYLQARIRAYSRQSSPDVTTVEIRRAAAMQARIWREVLVGCEAAGAPTCSLHTIPALNAVFDVQTERSMHEYMHPPLVIFALLYALAIACAVFAGAESSVRRRPSRGYLVGFSIIIPLTVYIVLDLEYPRRGALQLDVHDRVLTSLLAEMDEAAGVRSR